MRKIPLSRRIFLFLLIFSPIISPASALDSIKTQLLTTWRTQPEETIQELKNYWQLAKVEDNKTEVAWALNFQGIIFGALGEFDSSYAYYDQSLAYCRQYNIPEVEKKTLMNLAINYQYQGRYPDAMQQFYDAIRLFEKDSDTLGLAHAYNGLGSVYRFLGKPKKAVAAYWQAMAKYEALGARSQIGVVWSNLGILYRDLAQRDSAFYCLNKAEGLMKEFDDRIGLANLYINKGGLLENKEGKQAQQFYQKAQKIGKELGSSRIIAVASLGQARQNYFQKKWRLTILAGKEGLAAAREMEDLQFQQEALELLANASGKTGNSQGAFRYQVELKTISDSILNLDRQRTVAELEIQFETEKKEKEIAQNKIEITRKKMELAEKKAAILERDLKLGQLSQWIIIIAVAGILLLAGAVLFFFLQKEKRRRLQREQEYAIKLERERREREVGEEKLRISRELHDNIGSQLTFMVSSLDNMKYYLEAPILAQKLDQLSGFGRDAISDLRHAIWALKAEARLSDVILKVRQLVQRLSGNISARIMVEEAVSIDRQLNSVEAINLLRIVQEALQNAEKYAAAKQVTIRFFADKTTLKMEISDDGKGFSIEQAEAAEGEGLGNMRARAKAAGGELKLVSTAENGTQITFTKQFAETKTQPKAN